MVFLSIFLRSIASSNKQLQQNFLHSIRTNLTDPSYRQSLLENALKRGENVDMNRIDTLMQQTLKDSASEQEAVSLLLKLPNWTHPNVPVGDESASATVRTYESPLAPKKNATITSAEKLALGNNWFRYADLGLIFGPKTYSLSGPLSELESALIRFAFDRITAKSFRIVHVPELINSSVINGCGFPTDSYRSQVYKLGASKGDSAEQLCLIGTAEMALAGYLSNRCFLEKQLPLKLCAVSRCYRAEASDNQVDKGLYRVHQFYKVEMFVVAKDDITHSNQLLDELVAIEEGICQELGLSYRVLDIASMDLGLPAFRKYDVEAWLPGHKRFGELTSASNCIDWQSSRLGIRYKRNDGSIHTAHTLNGTALAVPRVLIALLETHQQGDSVVIPKPLRPYFGSEKLSGLARNWRSSPAQNISGLLDAP